MAKLIQIQPFKYLFLLGAVAYELLRLPITLLTHFFTAFRPLPQWSFRNSFGVYIARRLAFYNHVAAADNQKWDLVPGKEGPRFEPIPRSTRPVYQGLLTPGSTEPCDVGGVWYHQRPTPEELQSIRNGTQKVVLHFHGGAYARGNARDLCRFGGANLANHVGPTLCGIYRLTVQGHAFPAALQDAVTEYSWLINELGARPENVVLSGDSAGAHLAIGLLRYIETVCDQLPRPGSVLLWSPWVDVASAIAGSKDVRPELWKTDFLAADGAQTDARAFVGSNELDNPFINPVSKPFRTLTRLWVHAGGHEAIRDSISQFVANMRSVPGNSVELVFSALAPHDIFIAGEFLGWKEEVIQQVQSAASFISKQG